MSLLEKLGKALDDLDMDLLNKVYHDDYEFSFCIQIELLSVKKVYLIGWLRMIL